MEVRGELHEIFLYEINYFRNVEAILIKIQRMNPEQGENF